MNDPKSMMEFSQVGGLFDDYFRRLGKLKRFKYQMAMTYWPALVGQKVAEHTTPVRCENGVLFVEVSNAPWHNELQFMKREIVSQINRSLGGDYVKDLKFMVVRR